jgi:hypothetical protein
MNGAVLRRMDDDNRNEKSKLRVDAPVFVPQHHLIISSDVTDHRPESEIARKPRRTRRRKPPPPSRSAAAGQNEIHSQEHHGAPNQGIHGVKQSLKRRQRKKKQKANEEEKTRSYSAIRVLNDLVVPPSASSIALVPRLTGCWAKPLASSILAARPPLQSEKSGASRFKEGLFVLTKSPAINEDTMDTTDSAPTAMPKSEAPSVRAFSRRGPKDTSALMARLWNEVELHKERRREKQAADQIQEEKRLAQEQTKRRAAEASVAKRAPTMVDTSLTIPGIDSVNGSIPLCECVKSYGRSALTQALRANVSSQEINSAILLSIQLDLPEQLRILCSYLTGTSAAKYKLNKHGTMRDWGKPTCPSPIHYAVSNQRNDCLSVMLSTFGLGTLTSTKDRRGNSALHLCCDMGFRDTILLIIDFLSSQRNAQTSLVKCFSDRNRNGQTPLHCICEHGHTDSMDAILNHRATCGIAFLHKILSLEDSQEQTPLLTAIAGGFEDTVMSLLMWRGNSAGLFDQYAPCPLSWAVKARNCSMVRLLLEFNAPDSSGSSGFDLDEALWECVAMLENCEADGDHMDILSSLVHAGASPFWVDCSHSESAFELAVSRKDTAYLASLLQIYNERHSSSMLQEDEKRDPWLQYRHGLERLKGTSSLNSALKDSLFQCWNASSDEDADSHASCAIVLYNYGAVADALTLEILEKSIIKGSPISQQHYCVGLESKVLNTTYKRLKGTGRDIVEGSEALAQWSLELACLPWFDNQVHSLHVRCLWLYSFVGSKSAVAADVVLFSQTDNRYLVHSAVLQTCAKLAAALRFANLSTSKESDANTEVKVGLADEDLVLLLEHLYHGSMLSISTQHQGQFYSKLVDMLFVAQEYICSSLSQECEMRLLSNSDSFDKCFCCYCLSRHRGSGDSSSRYCECTYEVSGPSALISSENALDVLSFTAQLSEGPKMVDYRILSQENGNNKTVEKLPFQELQEQALLCVFYHFKQVVSNENWKHHVAVNDGENVEQAFLRLCLEDLADCLLSTHADANQQTSGCNAKRANKPLATSTK